MTTPPVPVPRTAAAPRTARATPSPAPHRTVAPDAGPPAGPVQAGSDEPATRLRVAVTRLHRRLRQESLAGLTPSQSSTLASIDRLGTPTLGALALEEQVQPPTVTRLVAGLEAAGLVARQADAGDGRVCRVRLTAEGRRTLERVRTLKHAFLTRRIAALDEVERARLGDLTALLEHLVADR